MSSIIHTHYSRVDVAREIYEFTRGRCGKKLAEYEHRVLRCRKCNFIGDRDVIATLKLYKKYVSNHSRCGVSGVALNAPKPNENPSGMQGNQDEAMKNTSNHMNLYES